MASWSLPLFQAAEPQAQSSSQSECREARYLDHHPERIIVLLQSSSLTLELDSRGTGFLSPLWLAPFTLMFATEGEAYERLIHDLCDGKVAYTAGGHELELW